MLIMVVPIVRPTDRSSAEAEREKYYLLTFLKDRT